MSAWADAIFPPLAGPGLRLGLGGAPLGNLFTADAPQRTAILGGNAQRIYALSL